MTNWHSLFSQNTMFSYEYVDFWPKIFLFTVHQFWNSTTELKLVNMEQCELEFPQIGGCILWSSSRHVFTNFPNTNLRIFSTKYVVFVLIFSNPQNWEKWYFSQLVFWPLNGLFWPLLNIFWQSKHYQYYANGIFLPKLFWPIVRKNCSSDWENLLKF